MVWAVIESLHLHATKNTHLLLTTMLVGMRERTRVLCLVRRPSRAGNRTAKAMLPCPADHAERRWHLAASNTRSAERAYGYAETQEIVYNTTDPIDTPCFVSDS